MKSKLSGNADVFNRLDQAYACWEEDMWRSRLRRRLSQFTAPITKSSYEPRATEVGFPIDGANKTKQLLLESISKGTLDHLLPAFYSKGIRSKKTHSMEELKRIDTLKTVAEKDAAYPDEIIAGCWWEEFHFPYYLGRWNSSSRRVYYIPNDLMLLLEATSLKGLTLRDVRLPFPSFAIALESPLVTEKDRELDFFLIGEFSAERFAYYGISRSVAKIKVVDSSLRAKIDAAAQKGNLRRFMQLANKELGQINIVGNLWEAEVFDWFASDADMDEDLEKTLSKAESDCLGDWQTKFFRVFIGLCFYLNTFNTSNGSSPDLIERMPQIKKVYAGTKDGPALMDAAEVCKVQSIVELSPEETTIIRNQLSGRGGWEVSAHFREGFWRRPPGEGHNPLAKKTIWVRPTLVRRDRLPDNALPFGVGKIVLS